MSSKEELIRNLLVDSHCDAVAVGVLDFRHHTFDAFEISTSNPETHTGEIYFDLASLTKPLVNSFVFLAQNIQNPEIELLINHRGGLPAFGNLSRCDWKEQILSYEIKESETLYSDFSALRAMLELEKILERDMKDLAMENLPGLIHWADLSEDAITLQNGFYGGKPNIGKVHDPNAHNIKTFLSHAGLFATIDAVCESLVRFDKKFNLLARMEKKSEHRFLNGFDTVKNPLDTLAGPGCSEYTFGHLGFTGTSFWIDPKKRIGHVILTNTTKYFWFDKVHLNNFRRDFGALIWKQK